MGDSFQLAASWSRHYFSEDFSSSCDPTAPWLIMLLFLNMMTPWFFSKDDQYGLTSYKGSSSGIRHQAASPFVMSRIPFRRIEIPRTKRSPRKTKSPETWRGKQHALWLIKFPSIKPTSLIDVERTVTCSVCAGPYPVLLSLETLDFSLQDDGSYSVSSMKGFF